MQRADALAIEQVIEAMIRRRDEDQHVRLRPRVDHLPVHAPSVGDQAELGLELRQREARHRRREQQAHEEQARRGIPEIRGLRDEQPPLRKKARHFGHNPDRVAARGAENESFLAFRCHASKPCRRCFTPSPDVASNPTL